MGRVWLLLDTLAIRHTLINFIPPGHLAPSNEQLSLTRTNNYITVNCTLTQTEEEITAIFDVIRTGHDMANFWYIKGPSEDPEPLDLVLNFTGQIDPYRFRPIPEVLPLGDHRIISPEWLETITQDGDIIQSLRTKSPIKTDELSFRLPLLITMVSLRSFTHRLGIRHEDRLRAGLRGLQGELKTSKIELNSALLKLTNAKKEIREIKETTGKSDRIRDDEIEVLKKTRDDQLSSIDRYKRERDDYRHKCNAQSTRSDSSQDEIRSLTKRIEQLKNQLDRNQGFLETKERELTRLKWDTPHNDPRTQSRYSQGSRFNSQPKRLMAREMDPPRDPIVSQATPKLDDPPVVDFKNLISKEIANQFRDREEDIRRKELDLREEAIKTREKALSSQNYPPNLHYSDNY